ncbi:hypothetical protein EVAR_6827_1 [Eumeta japonica]|uniref:Uncharacterized protein n=1 Tax=Eumeta variegata TaxID=151549 RepID=A0A4C1U677_EUMVA|nr:hypothetical protein EVAR_6827_1 [Eumeta japonica]
MSKHGQTGGPQAFEAKSDISGNEYTRRTNTTFPRTLRVGNAVSTNPVMIFTCRHFTHSRRPSASPELDLNILRKLLVHLFNVSKPFSGDRNTLWRWAASSHDSYATRRKRLAKILIIIFFAVPTNTTRRPKSSDIVRTHKKTSITRYGPAPAGRRPWYRQSTQRALFTYDRVPTFPGFCLPLIFLHSGIVNKSARSAKAIVSTG